MGLSSFPNTVVLSLVFYLPGLSEIWIHSVEPPLWCTELEASDFRLMRCGNSGSRVELMDHPVVYTQKIDLGSVMYEYVCPANTTTG